ncbi:PQQ-dependent sugar dehydrogenase [Sphingomonas mesophila]|uniref:PQQ-dependent sugar dehydrogenase n=1 Tax=Sphingomonas mesophila TaxID=2303576 RepID=UPI000E57DE54|nr:PQQ-dependent sugar dehydrogenase [Sphingomonas mesophila]
MKRTTFLAAGLVLAACADEGSAQAERSAPRPFTVTEVAKFDQPWAMDFLPGSGVPVTNQALVTEKSGELWVVDARNGQRWPVTGAPKVQVAGQGGLGDVVAHPDFAGNRRIYLSFVEAGERGTSGAALGYGTLKMGPTTRDGRLMGYSLENFRVIWRQTPKVSGNGHFAHRIAFGRDGLLYLTSGDRQKFAPAQNLTGNLGKVLRLTAEGAPAPGNPWAARGGVAREFWSIGHRNPLGIAFAPDGRLWSSEMGPQGGDEINLILPGRNYGWPRASNGSNYGGGDIPDHSRGDGFEPPAVWWTPSISPGGLLIYSGDLFKGWKGDALVPALSGEALIRVDLDGARARKADQWPMNARIRAVDQGPDGAVYLLEDGGRLLRLTPAR